MSIPFGLASVNMLYSPYVVGESAGIFKKAGIDLKLVLTRNAATAEQAVASGDTPIGAITTDAIEISHTGNPQVAILMPVVTGTPYSLMVQPSISSIADLRGKNLGASGLATADGGIIRAMLQQYGMQEGKDYTIQIAGNPASREAALLAGAVVGIAAPEPEVTQLKNKGYRELIRASEIPGLATRPFNMLTVNRSWAAKHPATVVAFERAWLKSVAYLYAEPNRSIAALSAALSVPPDVMRQAYDDWIVGQKVFPLSCTTSLDSLRNVEAAQVSLGNMKAPTWKYSSLLLGGKYCKSAMQRASTKKTTKNKQVVAKNKKKVVAKNKKKNKKK